MTTDLVHTDVPLEVDAVQHMSVVLNRAKGWLDEARSIDDVRQAKALAVGYESVIREKELAFDAQLAATELVRRCERRIGELVHEGQREGTIAKTGDIGGQPRPGGGGIAGGNYRGNHLQRPSDMFTDTKERAASYAMATADPEQFEQAISEAREEGNLSRANVVRKVKGEKPKSARSEWHRKTRHIDSNRILSTLTQELDALTSGLELMERDGLDPELVAECIPSAKRSISTINSHLRRIA